MYTCHCVDGPAAGTSFEDYGPSVTVEVPIRGTSVRYHLTTVVEHECFYHEGALPTGFATLTTLDGTPRARERRSGRSRSPGVTTHASQTGTGQSGRVIDRLRLLADALLHLINSIGRLIR